MTNRRLLYTALVGILLLTACDDGTVFHHYTPVDSDGWRRDEPIHFTVSNIPADGVYQTAMGLRISNLYPFKSITVIVEQLSQRSRQQRRDTVTCQLTNELGHIKGPGISRFQYSIPVANLQLHKDDTLNVSISHYMRKELLQGISDIGFKTTRIKTQR